MPHGGLQFDGDGGVGGGVAVLFRGERDLARGGEGLSWVLGPLSMVVALVPPIVRAVPMGVAGAIGTGAAAATEAEAGAAEAEAAAGGPEDSERGARAREAEGGAPATEAGGSEENSDELSPRSCFLLLYCFT